MCDVRELMLLKYLGVSEKGNIGNLFLKIDNNYLKINKI